MRQAGRHTRPGGAIADLLFGRVSPSGRLAETLPLRLQDRPVLPQFPGRFRPGPIRRGHLRRVPRLRWSVIHDIQLHRSVRHGRRTR